MEKRTKKTKECMVEIMQSVNPNIQIEDQAKVYEAPIFSLVYLFDEDVITLSNSNDNNFSDMDWD